MDKKQSKILIIFVILTLIAVIIKLMFFPQPKLKGNKVIELEIFNEYIEPGVDVNNKSNDYLVEGTVDTSKLGTYKLKYYYKNNKIFYTTRTIKIVDKTKPEINLEKDTIMIYIGEKYNEPGFTAKDNYDGDLTSKVVVNSDVNENEIGRYKIVYSVNDSNGNSTEVIRKVNIRNRPPEQKEEFTYINGILLVNKEYTVPEYYNPGLDETAYSALQELQEHARIDGYNIPLVSGFRSYSLQQTIYNNYVEMDGVENADTYSARPGHSEHQTGLAFDVGAIDDDYGETPEGKWLIENAHRYGFIIRYPKNKQYITGYKYEPWHIRYIGTEHAKKIYEQNITLEEYLDVY